MASNTCPVQSSITQVKQPREKAQKSSADYSAPIQKRVGQNPLVITYVANIYAYKVTFPPRGCQSDTLEKQNYKTNTSKNIIVTNQINRYRTLITGVKKIKY